MGTGQVATSLAKGAVGERGLGLEAYHGSVTVSALLYGNNKVRVNVELGVTHRCYVTSQRLLPSYKFTCPSFWRLAPSSSHHMFALRASTSAGLLRFPVRTVARWPVNYAASIAGGLGDASSSSRHFLKRTDWTPVRAASTDQAFSERRRRRQPSANRGRYYMKAILLHGMPQDRPVSELKEMVMKRFSKFGHVKFAMAGASITARKPDASDCDSR